MSFAKRVVEGLSKEQKRDFGIDKKNESVATRVISSIAGVIYHEFDENERAKKMSNSNDFIERFVNDYLEMSFSRDKIDEALEKYADFIKTYGSRYVEIDLSIYNDKGIEQELEKLRLFGDMVFIREDPNKQFVRAFIKEPVRAEATTPQEVTLDNIDRLQEKEYLQEFDLNGRLYWINKSKEEIPMRGSKATGRYKYNNQIIDTKTVSYDVNGDKPYTGPVLASPIGNYVDAVGRMFFDKSSALWNEDGTLKNDDELKKVLELTDKKNLGKHRTVCTLTGLKNLISDFAELEKQLEEQWPGYKAYSKPLQLFAKKSDGTWITGTPDLLIIDSNGVIHVLDFKTKVLSSVDGYINVLQDDTGTGYGKQLSRYIRMLQSFGFKVDEDPYVVLADTWYQKSDRGEYSEEKGDRIYTVDTTNTEQSKRGIFFNENNEESLKDQPLSEYSKRNKRERVTDAFQDSSILYIEPRLHVKATNSEGKFVPSEELAALRGKNEGIVFDDKLDPYERQFIFATEEERENAKYYGMDKPQSLNRTYGITKLSRKDISSRPELISDGEIKTVAESVMYAVSDLINFLARGEQYDSIPLSKTGKLKGKSHEYIIKKVKIENLIKEIFKEKIQDRYDNEFPMLTANDFGEDGWTDEDDYYHFDTFSEYEKEKKMNEKAKWLIDHYDQFVLFGYPKMLALEKSLVPIKRQEDENTGKNSPNVGTSIDPDYVKKDSGDNNEMEKLVERLQDGITDAEAWMMNQRNYSTKASLSQEIRRMFEDLYLLDENGNKVYDPYGWELLQHIDSTKAMQAVLDACKNCESFDDMKKALKKLANNPVNGWVNDILERISNDKDLQKKFFINFRKDSLNYSICQFKYDKNTGMRIVETKIINTKSATQSMFDSLSSTFADGNVGIFNETPLIEGHELNKKVLRKIREKIGSKDHRANTLASNVADVYRRRGSRKEEELAEFIKEEFQKVRADGGTILDDYLEVLNGIGVKVTKGIILDYVTSYTARSYAKGNAGTLIDNIINVLNQLEQQDKEGGIPHGLAGNHAFKYYFPIISKMSDFVQDHIEASLYLDGKTYYAYTNPSRLGHIIRNLTDAMGSYEGFIGEDSTFLRYLEENFGRYTGWFKTVPDENGDSVWLNDWVRQLATNTKAREALRHKVELSYIGNQYKNLGSLGFTLSLLHNYFGSKDDNSIDANYRWFGLPTMSNKPTNEFIRMLKYGSDTLDKSGQPKYKSEIIDKVLMNTFQQECNRIADVLFHYNNNPATSNTDEIDLDDDKLKGAGFSNEEIEGLRDKIRNANLQPEDIVKLLKTSSGAKFHFLWYLNSEMENSLDGKYDSNLIIQFTDKINGLLLPKDKADLEVKRKTLLNPAKEDALTQTVRRAIQKNMEEVVEAELKEFDAIGLFDYERKAQPIRGKGKNIVQIDNYTVRVGNEIVKANGEILEIKEDKIIYKALKYQSEFNGKLGSNNDEQAMRKAITEYVWQDIAANINIIQITGGDLAYYGNAVNYQKRIAQIHSPGLHLMHDPQYDDGYLRSVHISDSMAVSEVLQNALEALREYRDSIQDPNARAEFDRVIKIIAKEFEDINVTDGQSYSCPTSKRKKMALQGKWDNEMEKAYSKILKGDFNLNYLNVLLQPDKPFVTSDMAKYSGSPTMTLRRTPLQDKNSEYMIFLAEALSRGAGKRSKMSAIFDFMEKSAHEDEDLKKPTHTHGVDTVHFKSVGKVGVSGVIDIDTFDKVFNRMVQEGKAKEEEYNEQLTEFLLKHVRRADSKKESLQDPETLRKINKDCIDKGLLKPEENLYNPTYVDTIPIDDYIIQQEVPAHLLQEHGQLYGSQIRILGISDITPGTEFKVRRLGRDGKASIESMSDEELIKEYKTLHSKNIEDSFNELMIELGLSEVVLKDGKVTVKNVDLNDKEKREKFYKNLAYILRKELLKDSKYGFDSIRACSLEYDGESIVDFNIPLMDPIQSKRIQMLINSIIKKAINKQKILGGPVVQTTVYDNDLHIVFQDKDGNRLMTLAEFIESKTPKGTNLTGEQHEALVKEYRKWLEENQAGIAYFECYMPVPNAKLEKLIARRDGSLMTPEEIQKAMPEVWESMSKVIGYRIPTEDKYSMVPLKIKGFLPKIAGQAIMMPKEITLLTGSDFDIDKMYIMMKSFQEFDMDTAEEKMDSFWREFKKEKGDEVNLNKDNKYYDKAKRVMFNASQILGGDVDVNLYDGVDRKNPEIDVFVDWYRKRLLGTSFKEYSSVDDNNKIVARQSRNNRLLDIQWAVLTSKDTSSKMLNPGNFNEPKRVGRFIKILKSKAINEETGKPWTREELENKFNEILKGPYKNPFKTAIKYFDNILENANHHNTTLPSSKVYFQRQNMQGAQMVGIIANHSTSHAFCTFQKIGIDLTKGGVNRSFIFNGIKIGDVSNVNEIAVLDRQKGFNGQLISKSISTDLNSVLDTAKDPVSADSNINTFTVNVAMTLLRLGYDIETVCYFLSQPILVKLAEHYFKNKTNGFYNGDTAIKEVATEIGLDKKVLEDPKEAGIQNKSVLTLENFIDHVADNNFMEDTTEEGKRNMEFQKQILVAFNSLFTIANSIQELTFCTKFNSISNAVGPTIADTMEEQSRVDNFIGSSETNVFYTPSEAALKRGFTSAEEVIINDPILNSFYEHTLGVDGASSRIFEVFFPHYFEGFKNVLEVFKERYCRNGKINSKLYNQLLDEYLYYILTYKGEEINEKTGEVTREFKPTLPSSKEDKDYLIKHLIEEFGEVLKIQGRKPNLILDQGLNGSCLKIRHKDEYLAMDTLVFNGGQMNAEVQEKIKVAWSDMITSNDPDLSEEDNKKLRNFGIDLFFYTLMRNGFGFSPKTLMHLASVTVRINARYGNDYNPYVEGLRKLQELDTYLMPHNSEHIDRFLDQFIRNHSNSRNLVPTIDATNESLVFNEDEDGNVTSIEFVVEAGKEEKLYNIMLNTKQRKPYTFINLLRKNGKTLYSELYKVDNIRGVFSDGTKTSVLYEKVNILGFVNNFIEYDANSDLDTSYFGDTRNESPEAFDDEEQNQETGTDQQQEGDEVFNTEELNWNEFSSALKELEGEQKESRPYRTALWNAVNKTNNPNFQNAVKKAIDKTIDKLERQKAMDYINTDEDIQGEVKSIREKMKKIKEKENSCQI